MTALNRVKEDIRALVNHGRDRELLSWHFRHRKALALFNQKHRGEKCFIIGNGPSLNKMDLSVLSDCTCFGLNKIFLLEGHSALNINYHVAVNPLVIKQSRQEFAKLNCPSFLSYRACRNTDLGDSESYFLMTSKTPFVFRESIQDILFEGFTVTYVAMQIAYYMGFSEVYLIGVDHNFDAVGNPNEKQFMEGPDPNHFHPDYFADEEWHLPDLTGSEMAYRLANYHFERSGKKIFDATVEGKLAIFPKIPFNKAVAACRSSMGLADRS